MRRERPILSLVRTFALILAIGILLLGVGVPVVLCVALVLAPLVLRLVAMRVQVRCAAQPVALRALVSFRAPPSLS